MELILYIALGIVLGFFLLAFLDKVIVAVVIGVAVVIAFMVLLVAISVFDSMSVQDAQAFGVLLLVVLGLALAWDLIKLIIYFDRVFDGKMRMKNLGESEKDVDADQVPDADKREVMNSPYADNRYVVQRKTTVGWVTVDGADFESELKDVFRFGLIARLFFRKKHRIIENRKVEDFLVGKRAKRLAQQERDPFHKPLR